MIYCNITDIFEMLERTNVRFVASVSHLTEAQQTFRPAPDRWSIAENVEHVSIVSNGLLRLTFKLLKQAEADPRPSKADLQLPPLTTNEDGHPKFGKANAPDPVRPRGDVRVAESIAKEQQTINDLFGLKSRLEAVDLSDRFWEHPLLGQLNLYQWLLLLGEHKERHRLQIEDVKASPDFPV